MNFVDVPGKLELRPDKGSSDLDVFVGDLEDGSSLFGWARRIKTPCSLRVKAHITKPENKKISASVRELPQRPWKFHLFSSEPGLRTPLRHGGFLTIQSGPFRRGMRSNVPAGDCFKLDYALPGQARPGERRVISVLQVLDKLLTAVDLIMKQANGNTPSLALRPKAPSSFPPVHLILELFRQEAAI